MSFLSRLRTELGHTGAVYGSHDRLMELGEHIDFNEPAMATPTEAAEIATLLRAQADHLEASKLARATTALPTPAQLRAEADGWDQRAQAAKEKTS